MINPEIKQRENVVNNAVKICITCGSIEVKIDNDGIYCKDCDSKFQREGSI